MSTAAAEKPAPAPDVPSSVRVVSHTGLVYYWPVWLVGFFLYGLTYLEGGRLAVVPTGTTVASVTPHSAELNWPGEPTPALREATPSGREGFPVHVATSEHFGTVMLVVLLIVIFSTNVVLRGLWSLVAGLALLLVGLLFAWLGVWEPIVNSLGHLHVYISAVGYLFLSTVLLVLWLLSVFVFDQRRFMLFSPGQFIFHREIGDQSQVYDSSTMRVEKRRSDVIRHFLLGLGSGDLIVTNTSGSQTQIFELNNVLFVNRKLEQIAAVMKIRPVVSE